MMCAEGFAWVVSRTVGCVHERSLRFYYPSFMQAMFFASKRHILSRSVVSTEYESAFGLLM